LAREPNGARDFNKLYARDGRPSIPPERLLRALLLQAFYTVRSGRQLMEQLDYNLLFHWFVGLSADDPVWDATVFCKNRDRSAACRFARGAYTRNNKRSCGRFRTSAA
jgi:transposase